MKYIKIFLASSIVEFESERQQMASYINNLNNIYVRRGVYFELLICENLSTAMDRERKQDEYNRFIRDSQFFYIILGQKAGDYTIEEFDTAWDQFKNTGAPKVNTFFYELPEDKPADKSVLDFMNRLDQELGHFYTRFTHLDSVKLSILLEFTRDPELHSVLKFEDGRAVLDGSPMLLLDNIPVYSKNEQLNQWRKELKQLDGEFAALAEGYGKDPSLFSQMLKVGEQRAKLLENIHQWEMNVLDLYKAVCDLKNEGRKLNWREKKAMELLDAGNYDGAIAMLRDPAWKKEVEQAGEIIETKKEVIHEYISGQRLRISTLKSNGITTDNLDEIIECYEECVRLAEEQRIDLGVLYEYAGFLRKQRDYKKGIEMAERLRSWYQLDETTTAEVEAELFNLLGMLYSDTDRYSEAEELYREAQNNYSKLVEKDPSYLPNLASAYNNLATLLSITNRSREAENLYREALNIYLNLKYEDFSAHLADMVDTCHNLAVLLNTSNQYDEAEELFRKALGICQMFVEISPSTYLPRVASTCLSIANLLLKTNQYREAEKFYREALDIYQKLAEKNPTPYLQDMAGVYHNLARLLGDTQRFDEAEKSFEAALDIRRKLAEKDPSVYLPDVAATCNSFASLLHHTNRNREAEELYREALDIRRKLAEKNPSAYQQDVARTCNNFASLLHGTDRHSEAEKLYREAMDIHRKLAAKAPSAYLPDVAADCNNLGGLLCDTNRFDEAEKLYREALNIDRKLAEENPCGYLPDVARTCKNLAILLYSSAEWPELCRAR